MYVCINASIHCCSDDGSQQAYGNKKNFQRLVYNEDGVVIVYIILLVEKLNISIIIKQLNIAVWLSLQVKMKASAATKFEEIAGVIESTITQTFVDSCPCDPYF